MQLQDFATQVIVSPDKLLQYALNKTHPKGRHKAIIFEKALGYTTNNYQSLIQQIEQRSLKSTATLQRSDEHGQHVRVDLLITGINGQHAIVRAGWLIPSGQDIAHLTTLYVKDSLN